MDERIERETRGQPAKEVTRLNLDNCHSTHVTGLTEEFTNLEFLSMINVGLTSLEGFPKLPALKTLEISDNRITNGLENLAACPNLKTLNLSGNKIKDVKSLEPLQKLTDLKSLELFNCEIAASEKYREKVFETLPQLKYVDGLDRENHTAVVDEIPQVGRGTLDKPKRHIHDLFNPEIYVPIMVSVYLPDDQTAMTISRALLQGKVVRSSISVVHGETMMTLSADGNVEEKEQVVIRAQAEVRDLTGIYETIQKHYQGEYVLEQNTIYGSVINGPVPVSNAAVQ